MQFTWRVFAKRNGCLVQKGPCVCAPASTTNIYTQLAWVRSNTCLSDCLTKRKRILYPSTPSSAWISQSASHHQSTYRRPRLLLKLTPNSFLGWIWKRKERCRIIHYSNFICDNTGRNALGSGWLFKFCCIILSNLDFHYHYWLAINSLLTNKKITV
jgi:hypothetical protein